MWFIHVFPLFGALEVCSGVVFNLCWLSIFTQVLQKFHKQKPLTRREEQRSFRSSKVSSALHESENSSESFCHEARSTRRQSWLCHFFKITAEGNAVNVDTLRCALNFLFDRKGSNCLSANVEDCRFIVRRPFVFTNRLLLLISGIYIS